MTNFYDAFDTTFELIERTIQQESTSGCNVAVLFLTDGVISKGPGAQEVIDLVSSKATEIKSKYDRDLYLFTYSLGLAADTDVPKRIACETGGMWTQVEDAVFGGNIVSAMASYYKLFALGLGEGDNTDFVAMVEPYPDFNTGKMMITVSAPVYDRSVRPPLLLGVVGIDSFVDALEQTLGVDASSTLLLDRFIALSTARCPRRNLTGCELDALRSLGGGDQAICGDCPAVDTGGGDYVGIVPQPCGGGRDLPHNVWANTDHASSSYEEKACCHLGGSAPSEHSIDFHTVEETPAVDVDTQSVNTVDASDTVNTANTVNTSNTVVVILASIVAGFVIVIVLVIICCIILFWRKQDEKKPPTQPQNTGNEGIPNDVLNDILSINTASDPPVQTRFPGAAESMDVTWQQYSSYHSILAHTAEEKGLYPAQKYWKKWNPERKQEGKKLPTQPKNTRKGRIPNHTVSTDSDPPVQPSFPGAAESMDMISKKKKLPTQPQHTRKGGIPHHTISTDADPPVHADPPIQPPFPGSAESLDITWEQYGNYHSVMVHTVGEEDNQGNPQQRR